MKQNDDKLHGLLRQWRDIEPPTNFEANVRRQIRLAGPPRTGWAESLSGWLWQPAVAAAIVSVLIGSFVGVLTLRRPAPPQELQFMSAGTLAGGYVNLAKEEKR